MDRSFRKRRKICPNTYQVEIGAVEAYSREVDNGKGFVHYIEYRSARSVEYSRCTRLYQGNEDGQLESRSLLRTHALIPNDFFAVDTDSQT